MPTFAFSGRTRGGETINGERVADTADAVVAALRREQVLVTRIVPTKEKAELVASFVHDNRYGVSKVQEAQGEYGVLVTIHMPTEQHILCSVSGLMACICALFGLEYDGWGCVLQTDT